MHFPKNSGSTQPPHAKAASDRQKHYVDSYINGKQWRLFYKYLIPSMVRRVEGLWINWV